MKMSSLQAIIEFAKELWAEWSDDNATQLAASLAYYAIFSLSPLIIIGMAIISFFFERESAQGQLFLQVENVVGKNVTALIRSLLASASQGNRGLIASVISLATLIWGAASVFGNLQSALNTIWDVEPAKHSSIVDFIRRRAPSILLVLAGGVLGLTSLVMTTIFASLSNFVERVGFNVTLWNAIANFGLSFALIALLFALLYKVLPDIFVSWRDVWLDATVAALMFVLGKSLLGWYLATNSAISVYGAGGSLVALLLWIYYSSQIFFFGAEFSQVYSRRKWQK